MLIFAWLFTGVFRTLLRNMSRKVVGVVEMEDLQRLCVYQGKVDLQ